MMSIVKQQRQPWQRFRKHARARAKQLEKQVAISRLVAMADDPLDALATLWDLAALDQHRSRTRKARLHGGPVSTAPAPVSRLLTGFVERMHEKVAAIVTRMDPDVARRVLGVMPGFLRDVDAEDPDVVVLIGDLLPRSPDVIAAWIERHIDAIQRRFAS